MWYHVYTMYFLIAVLFALVVTTMILTKDTKIRVIYQRTHENADDVATKFNTGNAIIKNLDLQAGDEILISTSGTTYTTKFTLSESDDAKAAKDYGSVSLSNTTESGTIIVPHTDDDFAIRYATGNGCILEFIEVRSSSGLF